MEGCRIVVGEPPIYPKPWTAWLRSNGLGTKIKFGFEFIQIGKFRLGAVDDRHLSISCRADSELEL